MLRPCSAVLLMLTGKSWGERVGFCPAEVPARGMV